MMKKFVYIPAFLTLFILQIEYLTPLSAETPVASEANLKDTPSSEVKETPASGMSEREFFIAVQMPEYSDYTKQAKQLYNENKYKESIEISKKTLDLYNERYEEIKKGYEKYGASKGAQIKFECFPIFQYAQAIFADVDATDEHGVHTHTMPEIYFMLLKAHKLFKYISATYPKDYRQNANYSTTGQLLFNAMKKSKFTEEEVKTYEDLVKPYDFSKEEMRTLKNAVELINKVDKIAKEYKPKTEAPRPDPVVTPPEEVLPPAEGSAGEKVPGSEGHTAEK